MTENQGETELQRPQSFLSFSRLKDFQQCPLKYRFTMVDRIPEEPKLHLIFGTTVHQVLENLFQLPPQERTLAAAQSQIDPAFALVRKENPEADVLFPTKDDELALVQRIQAVIFKYFQIENPPALQNGGTETEIRTVLPSGVAIRGFIDRIDVRPDNGALRVVDYKTGKVPKPQYQEKALSQMRFYSLLLNNEKQTLPARCQLVYVEHGKVLTLDPQETDLQLIERDINDTWNEMEKALESGNFIPKTGPLCPWCSYQSICPAFGSELPKYDHERAKQLLTIRRRPTS
ncbi:hypothetical protein BK816_03950 [Boudabousia tangfeifanii]|uniref:PD-(D/E)XK endonuclease-like domain-containing protein n=1 Tax=Boudabousia tangfeifanii TaxID=1912795 RepID=A0A1D9MJS8_9ACTO|nr:PD-(D/E)XK nuclease family protein [Boudabousia tangfeifanii]AOZ72554.1 hypothetical protein BK816_03950 [Boudabousia tangfeifanii]